MTPAQERVIRFVVKYWKEYHHAPTYKEAGQSISHAPSVVYYHVQRCPEYVTKDLYPTELAFSYFEEKRRRIFGETYECQRSQVFKTSH